MQQNVLRLDVPVNDAVAVRILERVSHFAGDPQRVVYRELLLARDPVAERLAFHEWHDVEDGPLDLTGIEERKNVRMLQVRRGLDLGEKPLSANYRGKLRPQHLESDLAVVAQVVRQIDVRHSPCAQFPLYGIASREGGVQLVVGGSGHSAGRDRGGRRANSDTG